jgi:hypothetical protein
MRGKHVATAKKAAAEQQAADRILAVVDRTEHYKMLVRKYGPRKPVPPPST